MNAESIQSTLRRALDLHQAGQLGDAERLYGEVIDADPGNPDALNLRGVLAQNMGENDVAEGFIRRALAVNPRFADAHYNLGVALQGQGRLDDAAAAYRESLRLSPDSPDAHHNLGNCLHEIGKLDEAIECQRNAIAIDPRDPNTHNSLGVALYDAGALDEAFAAYDRAIALDAGYAAAHGNMAGVFLARGMAEEAVAAFRRAAELRHGHARRSAGTERIPRHRIHHDADQVRYLKSRDLLGSDYEGYARALCALDERLAASPNETQAAAFGGGENEEIAPSFNAFVYRSAGNRVSTGSLNPELNVDAIEASYLDSRPEVVVVDDLLSEEALAELRAFCLESTVWKRNYDNGYVSAKLGHGFESPLLFQIVEELRRSFPRIFSSHRLEQAWAFKYDSHMHGVNLHADFAAVNVNFWITPDSANRDPESGGLIIWDEHSPNNWRLSDYNRGSAKVRDFLQSRGSRPIKVPYRGNRAIIFNSTLFHETDRIDFEEGYENRRINVTLLYGRRLRTS